MNCLKCIDSKKNPKLIISNDKEMDKINELISFLIDSVDNYKIDKGLQTLN